MGKLIKGVNDFASLYPEIAKQWHPTKNGDITPGQVAAHSNKPFFWLCEKGHTFEATPDKRTREGCPYCSNRRVLKGFNDLLTSYPDIAKEWDYSVNDGDPEEYSYGSTYSAHWKCAVCGHEWEARIRDRVRSKHHLCPECAAKKRGEARHEHELQKKGGIHNSLLLAEWDYEKNVNGPETYTPKSNSFAFWVCSKCGYHYRAKISNRAIGRGCPCCAGKTVVAGINDLATTHPELAAEWHPTKNGVLKPSDVSYGIAKKVWWLCPEGHEYSASLLHRSSGTNCPICNSGRQTSFAEQAVFYYVKKVFPDAINRYTEIFRNGMELDIFNPSIKLAIEYDGEAWHKANKLGRERKKYQICHEHGIRLLRLREKKSEGNLGIADRYLSIEGKMYEHDQLAQIIQALLDQIDPETNMWTRKKAVFHSKVDINIDRDEADIRSYMTRLRTGSLTEDYPALTTEWHELKNGNLTPSKVRPHSDIRVWWICPVCGYEYPASIAKRTTGTGCPKCGIVKSAQRRSKQVIMYDLNSKIELRRFLSISEASRMLGISSGDISMVCRGNRKSAGGFYWSYAMKDVSTDASTGKITSGLD